MCGHVGCAGSMERKTIDAFNDLLHFDTVRGPHSTGIMSVGRGNTRDVNVFKRIGTAQDLMENKQYDKFVSMGKSVLLGHNRWATVGKVNNANAHPFEFSNVVGAHNGTIPWGERSEIIDGDKFDTDSEGIFNMINELGVEATMPQLVGAWALVWFDRRENTLNMLRNSERDLCWTYADDRKQIWWASEPGMLHAALARRSINYEKVWWLGENQWHSWRIPERFNDVIPDATVVPVLGRVKELPRVHDFRTKVETVDKTPREDNNDRPPFRPMTTGTTDITKGGWAAPVTVRKGMEALKCFKNELMYHKAYTNRTQECCAACDVKVPWADVMIGETAIKFINKDEFLCENCEADPFLLNWFVREEASDMRKVN